MKKLPVFVIVCVVAVGTAIGGCAVGAEPPAEITTVRHRSATCPVSPDADELAEFIGETKMTLPGESSQHRTDVQTRVMDGFVAGPSHVHMPGGPSISWGFEYQEGRLQSVTVYDKACKLRLVAIVDDMPLVGSMTRTMGEYKRVVTRQVADSHVTVFVRNAADLKIYLPFLYRWLEADLLGFNVNCEAPGMAETCALAAKIRLPLAAYQVPVAPGKMVPKRLAIPEVKAADVPLSKFVQ